MGNLTGKIIMVSERLRPNVSVALPIAMSRSALDGMRRAPRTFVYGNGRDAAAPAAGDVVPASGLLGLSLVNRLYSKQRNAFICRMNLLKF